MSLSRSLSIGTSSLRAHQEKFDVISNNIANVNTTGFKSSRTNFAEQFNQIYNYGKSPDSDSGVGVGGTNPYQLGLGVSVGSISKDMNQGTIETTNRPLDLALQGEGYFVYNINGQEVYSRAGAISYDKSGNLIDSNTGAFLQGYNINTDSSGRALKDSNGANILSRAKDNLVIDPNITSAPGQTQNIALTGNLNSSNPSGTERQTSINIYDNLGATHTINFKFTKTDNANEYTLAATLDGNTLTLPSSKVTFNNDGTLSTPLSLSLKASDLNTALGTTSFDATTPKDLTVQLAKSDNVLSGLTQYSGSNTATASEQDGYTSGSLNDLSVDKEGKIWGAFSNGQSEVLGQVVVAKFANPEALVDKGDNFFQASPNSGLANIGTSGETFPSTVVRSEALEQSNVDLTTEFTNMINTQRSYEAASKVITTSDEILQQLTAIKR